MVIWDRFWPSMMVCGPFGKNRFFQKNAFFTIFRDFWIWSFWMQKGIKNTKIVENFSEWDYLHPKYACKYLGCRLTMRRYDFTNFWIYVIFSSRLRNSPITPRYGMGIPQSGRKYHIYSKVRKIVFTHREAASKVFESIFLM